MPARAYAGAYNFPNGSGIEITQYKRVRMNSGNVAISNAVDEEDGLAASLCQSNDEVCAIEPLVQNCIYWGIADEAFSQGDELFRADEGKIGVTDNGDRFGIALDAASGAGSVVRFVYKGAESPSFD